MARYYKGKRIGANVYTQGKFGKGLREIADTDNPLLYSDGRYPTKLTAADLPEDYIKIHSRVIWYMKGYLRTSGIVDMIYRWVREKFVIYGLRRTGKTTMIRQILTELPETEFRKAAFIQVRSRDTLEDIVLLETKIAHPEKRVFKIQFTVGEFDMVVFDPKELNCKIYEVKYSKEQVPEQSRHLKDEEKCAMTSHRYGEITGKYVIYRGESGSLEGIQCLNVEEYLL